MLVRMWRNQNLLSMQNDVAAVANCTVFPKKSNIKLPYDTTILWGVYTKELKAGT